MQERVLANPKIEFLEYTEAIEVLWDGKLINGLKILQNQTHITTDIEIGWLFFAIGHTPNTAFLDGQIDVDEAGYIITERWTTYTSVPGVFAAGDVQDHIYRQAITSAGTGCMAAIEAEKFLSEMR
jgi:thioredoxin reductase (NADPH)